MNLAKIFSNDKDVNNTYKNIYLPLPMDVNGTKSIYYYKNPRKIETRGIKNRITYINYIFHRIIRTLVTKKEKNSISFTLLRSKI